MLSDPLNDDGDGTRAWKAIMTYFCELRRTQVKFFDALETLERLDDDLELPKQRPVIARKNYLNRGAYLALLKTLQKSQFLNL